MGKIKYIVLFVFCTSILAYGSVTYASEYGLPIAVPEDVGFSSEKLEKITPVLQGYVDKGQTPGFLTAIARKGKLYILKPLVCNIWRIKYRLNLTRSSVSIPCQSQLPLSL